MPYKCALLTLLIAASFQLAHSAPQASSVSYDAKSAGLRADGKTDDSAALNKAIDSAIVGNLGIIQLPCGQIMVNKPINLTNRSNLTFRGCASNLAYGAGDTPPAVFPTNMTQLLCNTGDVCLDTTGSSDLVLEKFAIRVARGYSKPSTIGILFGRDVARGEKARGSSAMRNLIVCKTYLSLWIPIQPLRCAAG